MNTYGEMVERILELDGRNVHIVGREEDATPKVLPLFLSFLFNFIEACQWEVYIYRSLGGWAEVRQ